MKQTSAQKEKKEIRFPVFKERFDSLFEKDESQEAFSKRVGLSRNTVAQYYNGWRLPDLTKLRKICERCNVSADWLVGLTDVKKPNTSIQAISDYTGLSEAAIKSMHEMKATKSTFHMEALSKALSSKLFLNNLSAFLLVQSAERGFFDSSYKDGDFYKVTQSPDMRASTLLIYLLHTLEAIRTDDRTPLQPYPLCEGLPEEEIEKLRSEGKIITKGGE